MVEQRIPLTHNEEVIGYADVNENYDVVYATITEAGPLYDLHSEKPELQWATALVIMNEQIDHAEYQPVPVEKEKKD